MKKNVRKTSKPERPSWDEYFLKIVDAVGLRATCDKSGSGCVVTQDNRIVATGYTGSLSGLPHCSEVGHQIKSGNCMRTIHAEQNAITQALKFKIPLNGAVMYCEKTPCPACTQMAKSLGIKKILTKNP
jgi:dCMP deaminase